MPSNKLRLTLGAIVILAVGVLVGMAISPVGAPTNADQSAQLASERAGPIDAIIASQEREVAAAQRDFDAAMADLDNPGPRPAYRPDPEAQMQERHLIELNEMICKQNGQNCEAAAMMRRHYNEKYNR